jgi:phytoene/squalene synthetase
MSDQLETGYAATTPPGDNLALDFVRDLASSWRAHADSAGRPAHTDDALGVAFVEVARRHNSAGLTHEVEPTLRLFYTRPFRVLGSGRFADACLERIADPRLRALPLVGSVDQVVDSTDVLAFPPRARLLAALYE